MLKVFLVIHNVPIFIVTFLENTRYRFIRNDGKISTSEALCTGFLNFPKRNPTNFTPLFLKIAKIFNGDS